MKNVIIAILVALLIVAGFMIGAKKKANIAYEPWPETEPASTTTPTPKPPVTSTSTNTNNNQAETSTSTNLENIETPIYIKSIYQKNGKWWADVDYVTWWNDLQDIEYRINNGTCVIPGMTKQQALEYSKTAVPNRDTPFGDPMTTTGCFVDNASDAPIIVNQNPLIRSFVFASNFKTINGCHTQNDMTIQDYKNSLNNPPYSYGLFNTRGGYYIRKAIIKNSEIEKFDQIQGCAG